MSGDAKTVSSEAAEALPELRHQEREVRGIVGGYRRIFVLQQLWRTQDGEQWRDVPTVRLPDEET